MEVSCKAYRSHVIAVAVVVITVGLRPVSRTVRLAKNEPNMQKKKQRNDPTFKCNAFRNIEHTITNCRYSKHLQALKSSSLRVRACVGGF